MNKCLFIFESVSILAINVVYMFPYLVSFILKKEIGAEIPDFVLKIFRNRNFSNRRFTCVFENIPKYLISVLV